MKLPNFNKQKIHIRKMDQKIFEIHSQKLQNIEPNITKTQVFNQVEKKMDMKKQQQLEDRYTQIEKDNRLLLEKIMNIMANKENPRVKSPLAVARPKSLNITRRRKDQEQIIRENLQLLKRISGKKSEYSKDHFDRQWRLNEKYSQNLGYFYPKIKKPMSSKGQGIQKKSESFNEGVPQQLSEKDNNNQSFGF